MEDKNDVAEKVTSVMRAAHINAKTTSAALEKSSRRAGKTANATARKASSVTRHVVRTVRRSAEKAREAMTSVV